MSEPRLRPWFYLLIIFLIEMCFNNNSYRLLNLLKMFCKLFYKKKIQVKIICLNIQMKAKDINDIIN